MKIVQNIIDNTNTFTSSITSEHSHIVQLIGTLVSNVNTTITSNSIIIDSSSFNGNLDVTDNTLTKIIDKIDNLSTSINNNVDGGTFPII